MAILGKCDTTEHTYNTSPHHLAHVQRTHERYLLLFFIIIYYYYLLLLLLLIYKM